MKPKLRDIRSRLRFVDATADVDLGRFPDFLIIGPQRTGTTWLEYNLIEHPEVFIPEQKELYYFNNLRQRSQHRPADAPVVRAELTWYLDFFRPSKQFLSRRKRECRARFGRPYAPIAFGEATASYAAGLDAEVIGEILLLNPDIRILLMVRDPIERAWSHVKKDFQLAGRNIADAAEPELLAYFSTGYQQRCGLHSAIHATWAAVVPAPNLFVGRFVDIQRRPAALLSEVFRFLGIDDDPRFLGGTAGERINATEAAAIPAAVLALLEQQFGDERARLRAAGLI